MRGRRGSLAPRLGTRGTVDLLCSSKDVDIPKTDPIYSYILRMAAVQNVVLPRDDSEAAVKNSSSAPEADV
jgi:hypothetical protein